MAERPKLPEFGEQTCVVTCCLCLEQRARWFGGHVYRAGAKVFAGWCEACRERLDAACSARLREAARPWTISELLRCDLAGWHGHWVEAMGLQSWADNEVLWRQRREEVRHG